MTSAWAAVKETIVIHVSGAVVNSLLYNSYAFPNRLVFLPSFIHCLSLIQHFTFNIHLDFFFVYHVCSITAGVKGKRTESRLRLCKMLYSCVKIHQLNKWHLIKENFTQSSKEPVEFLLKYSVISTDRPTLKQPLFLNRDAVHYHAASWRWC